MTVVKKVGVIRELFFGPRNCVGTGGVGAWLSLELLGNLIC